MSAHRLSNDLKEMTDTESLQIGNIDKGDGAVFVRGEGVPDDDEAGYAPGCLYVNTLGETAVTILYVNTGTLDACAFKPVGSLG